MFETRLHIHFISDWHVGSGLGDGAVADAVLAHDARGIPCIPGSAIKGALREGAWRLGLCAPELKCLTDFLFGTASAARVSNRSGRVSAGPAQLDQGLRQWLEQQERMQDFIGDLTIIRQQTSLDAQKMVVPHSLRSIECGIPGLTFTAAISAELPADAHAWFAGCLGAICACVKSIGAQRARGLGRCRLLPEGQKAARLPGALPPSVLALMESGRGNENS